MVYNTLMPLMADFHNHSCLSPCGSLDLSPRVLAETAAGHGIKVLALTDHNSSLNCPAFARVCPERGILPIFGLEATTMEEIHILCLFTNLEASLDFSSYAYRIIMPFRNNPEISGDQVYVDEEDNIEGEVEYYLVNPLELSVDEIGKKVIEHGGIVIPAHVDRPAFSMSSQLGVIVKGPWTALECTHLLSAQGPSLGSLPAHWPSPMGSHPLDTLGYHLITSSDAHHLETVATRSFELDINMEELAPNGLYREADMNALKKALEKRPVK